MTSTSTPAPRLLGGGLVLLLAALLLFPGGLRADETSRRIDWIKDLGKAFEAAKERDLPIMICINSSHVDGGRFEPAARELRERTYRHPDVVALSRKFVCAFLTSKGTSDDFGELRLRYGIDGDIISPQHIFAYPDGRLMYRKEYWPYGYAQKAVDKLLEFMNDALARDQARRGEPPSEGEPAPEPAAGGTDDVPTPGDTVAAPASGEERAKWIADQLARARSADETERRGALIALLEADREGDTVGPVLALLDEMRKHPAVRVDIVRALGRPGLEAAVKPLTKLLGAKEDDVRANAAVSLEYIGSKEAVADLRRRAAKEKDENIANHMYRALGRCGAGDAKVRSLLLKRITGAKSSTASYGPIIGLSYFGVDPKTAREVEKLLKKEGIPGGRGAWRGGGKRALLTWLLTEVGFGDPKAAKFVREELIPIVTANEFVRRFVGYYRAAAEACEGDEGARQEVADGTKRALTWRTSDPLVDDARRGRGDVDFQPKPEWST